MAKNTIALPTPTEKTMLKMLAHRSTPPPRIVTYPDGEAGSTAWVLSGRRELLCRMPVPPLFKLIEHQQPWRLAKNDWRPEETFEWSGPFEDITERLDTFANMPWDVELNYSRMLIEAGGRHGLARILTDNKFYWTIQETFSRCVHLLASGPRWYRNGDRTHGNIIRATVGYTPETPVAYLMPVVGFAPYVALGEEPLINGALHFEKIEKGG